MAEDAQALLKLDVLGEGHIKRYYDGVLQAVNEQYALAKTARGGGMDFSLGVETTPVVDLADRTEQIIGPPGVAKRYRELAAKKKDRMEAIFKIVEEIIKRKLVDIPDEERRVEQAVKTALVLETEGVVVAPLDGVPKVKISKNFDGSRYVDIYYAGPIRAAGGAATVLPLLVGDYARKLLGLDRYKPLEGEIERYVEEVQIYDEIFTRQYKTTPDEVRKIIRGCPVCINGEPTEKREVTANKDLERISTNRVRGGMCLVVCEGIALKAVRILREAKKLGLEWSWLEDIIKVGKASEHETASGSEAKYLTGTAAGRPIFAYQSRPGGFRLRYGRARNTGIMGKALHPATMHLLDGFIAVGTQMKIELPGKSTVITPCDTIEGPVVRLLSGDVVQVNALEDAVGIKPRVEKILFLGDLLVAYGDFRHSNNDLAPPGYCEEWWAIELREALKKQAAGAGARQGAEAGQCDACSEKFVKDPKTVDPFSAVELSMQLGIPLHPHYLQYYKTLGSDGALQLVHAVRASEKVFDGGRVTALVFDGLEMKPLLERIGLPHRVEGGKIIVGGEFAYPFLKTFGGLSAEEPQPDENVLAFLTKLSGLEIRDKGGTFIGARMGRPEAAKPRRMKGNPHVLFPIGLHGGNTRSVNKAVEGAPVHGIEVEVADYMCESCKTESPFAYCPHCKGRTVMRMHCPECGAGSMAKECRKCGSGTVASATRKILLGKLLDAALRNLKVKSPAVLKGVKGMTNANKVCEPLEKGILRANNGLQVFKDGTVRFEMLNVPLTHFRPEEIGMSVEKARMLGYDKDVDGKPLEGGGQVLELLPQDVIINRESGDFFVRVAKFIDELLERFYGLEAHYSVSSKEELVGKLVVSLAPHTSAAIVGRIIGYTEARVNFAHPYFHMTKRRNCDGEQDSFMLLLDVLLNFSKGYLPATRGGRMDAPLVFTVALKPAEIDTEVYDMETCSVYPLQLYEYAGKSAKPTSLEIPRVLDRLGTEKQYSGFGFTHDTGCIDAGPKVSRYVQLDTMWEKISAQAKIQSMIEAVDEKDALERVLVSHFIPDIIGNARSFSRQTFRCTRCNAIYRRIPLSGKCTKCTGGNIVLTIAQASVRKYITIAKELVSSHGLSAYLKQRLDLIEQEVDSVFTDQKPAQKDLLGYV